MKKINFIKKDIEAAKMECFEWSNKTINRSKPKLAIALSHSTKDFDLISRLINDVNLGYNFIR